MAKYRIATPVERAEGYQYWLVHASSEAEAIAKFKNGESIFEDEEIEVTKLGDPEAEILED